MPPRGTGTTDPHNRDHGATRGPAVLTGPKALHTRETLVAAAKAQFLERGYGETTVEQIARRPTYPGPPSTRTSARSERLWMRSLWTRRTLRSW